MALTAGRTAACNDSISGGVVRMALADRADVDSITVDATNNVTAITMAATKTFFQFAFTEETLRFTEEGALQNNTALFTQRIAGDWNGWSQADRNLLVDIAASSQCGMVCIAELENGQVIIFGINPDKPTVENKYTVKLESSNFDSGAAFEDVMRNTITLFARTSAPATKFTPNWAGVPL